MATKIEFFNAFGAMVYEKQIAHSAALCYVHLKRIQYRGSNDADGLYCYVKLNINGNNRDPFTWVKIPFSSTMYNLHELETMFGKTDTAI